MFLCFLFMQAWISDTVVGDFQNDFLVDLDVELPKYVVVYLCSLSVIAPF